MLVRAVVSFSVAVGGEHQPWPMGKVAEMPEGVNWLDIGWVVPVEASADAPQGPVAEETPDEPVKVKRSRSKKATDGG